MGCQVIATAAIARVGGRDVWLSRGDVVPEEADSEHVAHLVRMGLVSEEKPAEGEPDVEDGTEAVEEGDVSEEKPARRGPGRPRKTDN
jgi:hypothetical protein